MRLKKGLGGPKEEYITPDWCVIRLLEKVWLPKGRWLEPCAGTGAIISTVSKLSDGICWSAVEIQEKNEAALRVLSLEELIIGDFLQVSSKWPKVDRQSDFLGRKYPFDVIITNPPFSLALNFLEIALQMSPWVVFLLRLGWLGTSERVRWLRDRMPSHVWVLPDRPSFTNGGTDSSEYAWMVWGPDSYKNEVCSYKFLGLTSIAGRKKQRSGQCLLTVPTSEEINNEDR